MPMKLGVAVKDIDQIKRRYQNAEADVIAPRWSEAMEAIGTVGQNLGVRNAPLGPTGRTISMMYHRVQQKPLPLWVRIGTHARRASRSYPRGYAYPRRLNYDSRSRYRGWFDRAMDQTRQAAKAILEVTAKKIEAQWKRG